jgi:hypothetical protein
MSDKITIGTKTFEIIEEITTINDTKVPLKRKRYDDDDSKKASLEYNDLHNIQVHYLELAKSIGCLKQSGRLMSKSDFLECVEDLHNSHYTVEWFYYNLYDKLEE